MEDCQVQMETQSENSLNELKRSRAYKFYPEHMYLVDQQIATVQSTWVLERLKNEEKSKRKRSEGWMDDKYQNQFKNLNKLELKNSKDVVALIQPNQVLKDFIKCLLVEFTVGDFILEEKLQEELDRVKNVRIPTSLDMKEIKPINNADDLIRRCIINMQKALESERQGPPIPDNSNLLLMTIATVLKVPRISHISGQCPCFNCLDDKLATQTWNFVEGVRINNSDIVTLKKDQDISSPIVNGMMALIQSDSKFDAEAVQIMIFDSNVGAALIEPSKRDLILKTTIKELKENGSGITLFPIYLSKRELRYSQKVNPMEPAHWILAIANRNNHSVYIFDPTKRKLLNDYEVRCIKINLTDVMEKCFGGDWFPDGLKFYKPAINMLGNCYGKFSFELHQWASNALYFDPHQDIKPIQESYNKSGEFIIAIAEMLSNRNRWNQNYDKIKVIMMNDPKGYLRINYFYELKDRAVYVNSTKIPPFKLL